MDDELQTIERLESNVRCYSRSFPTVFSTASGDRLVDVQGREFIDFFAGAGALNYGHNRPDFKRALIEYIESDGITHSLDMASEAKISFLKAFEKHILVPRDLDYKVMFTGPTGTNSVEAALKLARQITGRKNVVSFTNAFHGMTLGSLAVTASESKRDGAGVELPDVSRVPFDQYLGEQFDTLELLEKLLLDSSSGVDKPAAVILETVQAEGGINVATREWLQGLQKIVAQQDVLLSVDDIQVGCGRTGKFFSFERAGIVPDIVCLSKSLSGYGVPFAITLMKRELDAWEPGKHNGTFRGHNLAFVTGEAAIQQFWANNELESEIIGKGVWVRQELEKLAKEFGGEAKGLGLIQGIAFPHRLESARAISRRAFSGGLLIETAGASDEVIKILPPLTIDWDSLKQGLQLLIEAIRSVMSERD
ncbi:MAG: diaminobutyrate--2-oxoglutarate transaminase [Pirellulaceae bacterium]